MTEDLQQRTAPEPVDRTPLTAFPWRAVVAVAITIVAWASAFVAIRYAGRFYEPGSLALGRLTVAAVVLGVVVWARGTWVRPNRREWGLILVCGLAWFGIYNVALNAAELRLDAGTTSLLVNVGPIVIAVIAGVVLGEGFPRWLVIGAAVAFGGVAIIAASTAQTAHADLLGAGLCLIAALTYAIGVVSQKPVLRRIPALQVTWLAATVGALACVPFTGDLVRDVSTAPTGVTAWVVYLGVVPTALAFSTWAYALARMNAGRLGVTTYLVPPVTVLIAWVLLGESPAALALVGGLVCLLGVGLSRRRDRPAGDGS